MRGDNGWGSGATGFFVSRRALAHSRRACAASFGRSCELRRPAVPFPLAGTAAYTTSLAGGELQFDRMSAFK